MQSKKILIICNILIALFAITIICEHKKHRETTVRSKINLKMNKFLSLCWESGSFYDMWKLKVMSSQIEHFLWEMLLNLRITVCYWVLMLFQSAYYRLWYDKKMTTTNACSNTICLKLSSTLMWMMLLAL